MNERVRNIQHSRSNAFWASADRWPADLPEYVFFGRAIDRVGQSRFAEWKSLPLDVRRNTRFRDVVASLRDELMGGRLQAAAVMTDGRMAPINAHRWNTDDYRDWLLECRIPSHSTDPEDRRDASPGGGWGIVEWPLYLYRATFEKLIGNRLSGGSHDRPAHKSTQNQKGRAPTYHWPAFIEAAIAKLEEEGDINPSFDPRWNKAALEQHMAKWCQNAWGVEPSESTIRAKVSEAVSRYREGREGF